MRLTLTITAMALLLMALVPTAHATRVDGTIKLGGIILDESGDDKSAVQETYNIHDGFSVSQVYLNGSFSPKSYFMLNLREINLDARQADLVYRSPGLFRLTGSFDQHTQVFDQDRAIVSERKDWRLGAQLTPARWLRIGGNLGYLTREGERQGFTPGVEGARGTMYDYALTTGSVDAEVRKDRRGVAVQYRISDYGDDLGDGNTDRRGQVVSARAYAPCFLWDKLTHSLRGAYGLQEIPDVNLDYNLYTFQYTGLAEPVNRLQLKYAFGFNRVDHEGTRLETDRLRHDIDATVYYPYGKVFAGYGYESNDDDFVSTSYNAYRAGTVFQYDKRVTARLRFASRTRDDDEALTLLQDVEATQFRVRVQFNLVEGLTFGGGYSVREREMPDIGVKVEGMVANGFGSYAFPEWGSVWLHYTYTDDEYTNRGDAAFAAASDAVTSRVQVDRIPHVFLTGGVTYLNVGNDFDIDKTILFAEARYTVAEDYHLEVRYNRYDYEDLVLVGRNYEANAVWINFAYDLHVE